MPVPVQIPSNSSTANGVTLVFPYAFKIVAAADLLVTSAGATKVLGVDYTVSGVGNDAGGNVTFISGAPANLAEVVRRRNMAYSRSTDYQLNGDLLSETLDADQDAPVLMAQQLAEGLGRAIKLPPGSTLVDVSAPVGAGLYLRWNLAGTALESVANLDGTGNFLQSGSGAALRTASAKLGETVSPEDFGADPTGVALSNAAFAACAALGKVIKLAPGAIYYLSARVSPVSNSRFVCDGMCTIKIKTGAGGFTSVAGAGAKDANAIFFFSGVDNCAVEGVKFTVDGVQEVSLFPIRVIGGGATNGFDFHRIVFSGLSATFGGYLSINSVGAGAYRVTDILARNCGTALGNTYWTGTPGITVFEIDNDMLGGVPSEPGHGRNIGAINVLFTGAALTNYGQQTDCVNIAGVSGTDRKGPTIHDVYADGVGEAVDLFCTGATITGVRARNVHNYVAKFVHGARHNVVQVDVVESFGFACVYFGGSSQLAVHTEFNVCRVGTVKGCGDAGAGPVTADTAIVQFSDNAGSAALCLPKNNLCEVGVVIGGANLDYIVRDGGAVNANKNIVRVGRASGFALAFSNCPPTNVRVVYRDRARTELSMSAGQTLTTAVDTTLQYNTVVSDDNAQGVLGSYKVRVAHPGLWRIKGSVRVTLDAGNDVELSILKGAAVIATACREPVGNSIPYTYEVDKTIYVNENDLAAIAADFSISAKITSASAITTSNPAYMTYFEAVPVG